jgi:hypothetical protein
MERGILNRALRPGDECLSVEQIGRFADGAMAPRERASAEAHIASCATCQSELTLLQAFSTTTVRDDEADAVREGVATLRRRESEIFGDARRSKAVRRDWIPWALLRPMAGVAVVLLFAGTSYYLFKSTSPQLPTVVGTDSEVTRSLTVSVRGPVGDQAVAPERLEWTPVSGAVRYHVRLMEVDRRELWSSDTTGTMATLPDAIRAQIVPAKTLLWDVTAIGSASTPIAESGAQRFRLAR